MRYFLLINVLILCLGCGSSLYKGLPKTRVDSQCLQAFKPVFGSVLYNASIDVVGKHLSGLLLIKKMPDSSLRMVFTNEMGFTLFDFGFSESGEFTVYQVFKQMNKKPVLKTLRKDFELVLMKIPNQEKGYAMQADSLAYFAFPQSTGDYYYITTRDCKNLLHMERASKKKVVVEAVMLNYTNGTPDSIGISHKNFNFDIALKKIAR